MRGPKAALVLAIVGAAAAPQPIMAEEKDDPRAHAPALAPLAVGPLQMASNADLSVERIDVAASVDEVAIAYVFRNKGAADLNVAASVAIRGLSANADSGEPWRVAGATAENPVGLAVLADGAPVALKTEIRAEALGVDRSAEIKAAHLPLLPFAPGMDRALAALSPQSLAELSALAIVSPHDPDAPDRKPAADWTLEIVYSWRQLLPANKMTTVEVKYKPLKAEAHYKAADALDIEDLKDEACLTQQSILAAQALLKSGNGAVKATEIALVNQPPVRWFDSPAPTIAVHKPRPDAIVGFCGIDAKTADQKIVRGSQLGGADPRDFRILIFEAITN